MSNEFPTEEEHRSVARRASAAKRKSRKFRHTDANRIASQALFRNINIDGFDVFKEIKKCIEDTKMRTHQSSEIKRVGNLVNLISLASSVPHGVFVECGVYRGTSGLLLARYLRQSSKHKESSKLYLIDTFAGFSGFTEEDYILVDAEDGSDLIPPKDTFKSTDFETVKKGFSKYQNVDVICGDIVHEISHFEKYDEFSFVHLDMDLYKPTKIALEFFVSKLTKGGVVLIDDYKTEHFPGATLAADEFFSLNKLPFTVISKSQAVYVKS